MARQYLAHKLLLVEDVDGLGHKGELVTVRPGYARNYLIPKQFAVIANPHTLRMQAKLQETRKAQALVDKQESEELAKKLQDATLSIEVKIDHDGHMYGSVAILDILRLLAEQMKVELERRNVILAHPIKETGVHTIHLQLKEKIPATVTLKVIAEGAEQ